MAHFAKLDENDIVLEVHVVNNDALDSNNEEESGIAFLTEWSKGYHRWIQCSFNAKFRKNYPAAGYYYNRQKDAFIPPKPEGDFHRFDEDLCRWVLKDEYLETLA